MPQSFITQFLDYTSDFESPESFFYWAAITTVVATMRDNIFIQTKKGPIYPNIYTLLIADSAIDRKGLPLQIARSLLEGVGNTKVMSGRASIQAIIFELSESNMNPQTGVTNLGGSAIILAEELAAFFVQDAQTPSCLTDIYDYREEYKSSLKGEGKRTIKNLCVTMLGASNEAFLKEVYTGTAIYGGLLGRTAFVKPRGKQKPPNSLLGEDYDSVAENQKKNGLINQLKEISKLRGKMLVEPKARQSYDGWYTDLRNSYKSNIGIIDKSGIIARIHTTILKVAMAIGIAHNMQPMITEADMDEAITKCLELLPNYDQYINTTGKANIATAGTLLLGELNNCPQVSKRAFLGRYWSEVEDEIFDKMVGTLIKVGYIEAHKQGLDIMLSLTPAGRDKLNNTSMNGGASRHDNNNNKG